MNNETYAKQSSRITRLAKRREQEAENVKEKEKKSSEIETRRAKKQKVRLVPVWIKVLIACVCVASSAMMGLVVGYYVVGDGESPWTILQWETWEVLLEYINGS